MAVIFAGSARITVKTAKWLTELDIMENFDHRVPHNFLSIEEFEEEHKRHKIAMVLAHYCMMVRSEERDETMDKFRPWSVSMQHPTIIYPNTAENCKMLGIPRILLKTKNASSAAAYLPVHHGI